MGQRVKTITIDKQKITVYELSVKQIRNILDSLDSLDNDKMMEVLALCSDVTVEQLSEMYPSDIRQIWDAWAEVNQDFLYVIRQAWKRPAVRETVDALLSKISTEAFGDLLSAATGMPGIMDGDFLNTASNLSNPQTGTPVGSESSD